MTAASFHQIYSSLAAKLYVGSESVRGAKWYGPSLSPCQVWWGLHCACHLGMKKVYVHSFTGRMPSRHTEVFRLLGQFWGFSLGWPVALTGWNLVWRNETVSTSGFATIGGVCTANTVNFIKFKKANAPQRRITRAIFTKFLSLSSVLSLVTFKFGGFCQEFLEVWRLKLDGGFSPKFAAPTTSETVCRMPKSFDIQNCTDIICYHVKFGGAQTCTLLGKKKGCCYRMQVRFCF